MWVNTSSRFPLYNGNYLFRLRLENNRIIRHFRLDYKKYEIGGYSLTNSRRIGYQFFSKEYRTAYSNVIIEWWEEPLVPNDERLKVFKIKIKV